METTMLAPTFALIGLLLLLLLPLVVLLFHADDDGGGGNGKLLPIGRRRRGRENLRLYYHCKISYFAIRLCVCLACR